MGERRKGVTVRGRERGVKDGERRKWDGTRKGEGEGGGREGERKTETERKRERGMLLLLGC